ncbi:MAG: hypothetical protein ACOC5C_03970 [Halobacteriota archaeon]
MGAKFIFFKVITDSMFNLVIFVLTLLILILFSGFFLWAGLRLIGKKRGIFESGVANLLAGFIAFVVVAIFTQLPLVAILFPIIGYLAYLYSLKLLLSISFLEAFIASILASVVFVILSVVVSMVAGIWLFNFTPAGPPHGGPIHF